MRILIVEDELKVSNFIKRGLKEEGHVVDQTVNGEEAYFLATTNDYDLLILDVMLPGIDGLTLCQKLRGDQCQTPILMLTAKDSITDKVKGLESGADDYVTKPFAFEELLARVKALGRRQSAQGFSNQLKVGDLLMDLSTRQVYRDGKNIQLSNKEFALLEYFMRHAGSVITRTMIAEHVWDVNFDTFTNVIDVYVNYIRNKVDHDFEKKLILTIRGRGYMLKKD